MKLRAMFWKVLAIKLETVQIIILNLLYSMILPAALAYSSLCLYFDGLSLLRMRKMGKAIVVAI